jgi:hypothetical protein
MKSEINPNRMVPSFCNGHREDSTVKYEVFYTVAAVNGYFFAIGYGGKRTKHDFYIRFNSEDKMRSYINDQFEFVKSTFEAKAEKKAKEKVDNDNIIVNVGDIFCHSWGYDQTNVDFYQVIEVKGKTATIKRIHGKHVNGSDGFMSCQVSPDKDNFTNDDPMQKRIKCYGSKAYFSTKYGSMQSTTETSKHYMSWYA